MQKVLVVRNDKLGDFMLAWPAFAMLKQSNPTLKLTALVPQYTADLARICPYLDDVIIDSGKNAEKSAQLATLQAVKEQKFDAAINFFSDKYNALLVWKAKIPFRLAPATKLIQFLYNHRVTQRRSKSIKPEFEYNLDLARAFLQKTGQAIIEPKPPYLTFEPSRIQQQKSMLVQQLQLDLNKKWIFVHSGSGGSATNLSLAQYAELIVGLLQQFDCHIILTAGPNESEKAHELAQLINDARTVIYDKNHGLVDFACSLACSDLFIAGSTGPLHLSAALNIATIGFYPSRRSATPLRWQPINEPKKHLAFSPQTQNKADQMDLSLISIQNVLSQAIPFIMQAWSGK
ncbi:glycosyltransferase family 9 protein [Pasteurella canis]|uniref:Glycosyltransferase n=1 Tax=Pasteurella canis TaxID=753 RepID=A0ABQ4VHT4_9PAST|nr:glycosyltransferase family 9 protein [Pasteurella canis]UEC23111.1 glycosyltransferase family 9 protein [Pasteurella canis]GJH43591.1 putative glycosyltransferase [Pasteurella canis]